MSLTHLQIEVKLFLLTEEGIKSRFSQTPAFFSEAQAAAAEHSFNSCIQRPSWEKKKYVPLSRGSPY